MAPGLRRLLRQPRLTLTLRRSRTASKPVDSPLARDRLVRAARQWAWLLVLTVGFVLFVVVNDAYQSTDNLNLIPSLLLLGSAVVPAGFVTFIASRPISFDAHALTVLLVAFLGGVTGVVAASLIEYQTLSRLGTLPLVAVGAIEESVKLLAPAGVLIFARNWRSPNNGLLLGVASGAGFAVMESLGYSAVALIRSHEQVEYVDSVLLQRGLFSPATHMAWTGLTGAALWNASTEHWRPRALAKLAGAFLLAVGLHTAWNTYDGVGADISTAIVSLASVALCARLLGVRRDTHVPHRHLHLSIGSPRELAEGAAHQSAPPPRETSSEPDSPT